MVEHVVILVESSRVEVSWVDKLKSIRYNLHLPKLKYTPTQLGVTGSLLPKTVREAPPNSEVNRKQKEKTKTYRFVLNSENVDRSLIAKEMPPNMATVRFYLRGVAWNFRCGI